MLCNPKIRFTEVYEIQKNLYSSVTPKRKQIFQYLLPHPLEKASELCYSIRGLAFAEEMALYIGKLLGKLIGVFENSFPV